jgi:hypothetical protein
VSIWAQISTHGIIAASESNCLAPEIRTAFADSNASLHRSNGFKTILSIIGGSVSSLKQLC